MEACTWTSALSLYVLMASVYLGDAMFFSFPKILEPGDVFVFQGETLVMVCKPPNAASNYLDDLTFTLTNTHGISWSLPHENVTVVEGVGVKGHILITAQFDSTTSVSCMEGSKSLDSKKIFIEKPLLDVSDIGGYFFDDWTHTSYVHIYWSDNADYYLQPSLVSTSVAYANNVLPTNWSAEGIKSKVVNNYINIEYDGQHYIYLNFKVSHQRSRLRPSDLQFLTPLYNITTQLDYKFILAEHRKTGPIVDVQVVETDTTCISVIWTLPFYFTDKCGSRKCAWLLYQVELKFEDEDKLRYISGKQENASPVQPVMLCDLAPYNSYKMRVRVRDSDTSVWSDYSTPVTLTTLEDKPLTGPVLIPSAYYIASRCNDNLRTVYIYWNSQSRETVRGEVKRLEVDLLGDLTRLSPGSNYYRFEGFPCLTAAQVNVSTVTGAGSSLVPSTIVIPAADNELGVPEELNFVVELLEGESSNMLTAKWNPQAFDNTEVNDATLVFYMCEEAQVFTCIGDYTYLKTRVDTGSLDVGPVIPYVDLFGFSLLSEDYDRKTGIQWTECVYSANSTQTPAPLSDVYVGSGRDAGSLFVSWTSNRCDSRRKVLVGAWLLTVCPAALRDTGDQLNDRRCSSVKVPSTQRSSHVFTDLAGGHKYNVYLQSEWSGGVTEPVRAEGVAATDGDNSSTVTVVMVTLSVVIGLAVLIVCLCCVKKFRRSERNFKAQIKGVQDFLPKIAEDKDKESGFYTAGTASSLCEKHPSQAPKLPQRNNAVQETNTVQNMSENVLSRALSLHQSNNAVTSSNTVQPDKAGSALCERDKRNATLGTGLTSPLQCIKQSPNTLHQFQQTQMGQAYEPQVNVNQEGSNGTEASCESSFDHYSHVNGIPKAKQNIFSSPAESSDKSINQDSQSSSIDPCVEPSPIKLTVQNSKLDKPNSRQQKETALESEVNPKMFQLSMQSTNLFPMGRSRPRNENHQDTSNAEGNHPEKFNSEDSSDQGFASPGELFFQPQIMFATYDANHLPSSELLAKLKPDALKKHEVKELSPITPDLDTSKQCGINSDSSNGDYVIQGLQIENRKVSDASGLVKKGNNLSNKLPHMARNDSEDGSWTNKDCSMLDKLPSLSNANDYKDFSFLDSEHVHEKVNTKSFDNKDHFVPDKKPNSDKLSSNNTDHSFLDSGGSCHHKDLSFLDSGESCHYKDPSFLDSGESCHYKDPSFLDSVESCHYKDPSFLDSGESYHYKDPSFLDSGESYHYKDPSFLDGGESCHYKDSSFLGSGKISSERCHYKDPSFLECNLPSTDTDYKDHAFFNKEPERSNITSNNTDYKDHSILDNGHCLNTHFSNNTDYKDHSFLDNEKLPSKDTDEKENFSFV